MCSKRPRVKPFRKKQNNLTIWEKLERATNVLLLIVLGISGFHQMANGADSRYVVLETTSKSTVSL